MCEDFFALRTPLLSVNEFLGLGAGELRLRRHHRSASEESVRERLAVILRRAMVKNAIAIASPVVYAELWRGGRNIVRTLARNPRLERSVVRYIARMATRSTPFGLFGTVALGRVSQGCNLQVPRGIHRVYRTLDRGVLSHLNRELLKDKAVRGACCYRVTSTLTDIGDRLRFAGVRAVGEHLKWQLTEVAWTDALRAVVGHVGSEEVFYSDLVAVIVRHGYPSEVAAKYVDDLIDVGVLCSDLDAPVTGEAARGSHQPGRFTGLTERSSALLELATEYADNALTAWRAADPALAKRYVENGSRAQKLVSNRNVAYVIAVRESRRLTLGRPVVARLRDSINELKYFLRPPNDVVLDEFRSRFRERYERQFVPLLEALDPEIGIGLSGSYADASRHGDEWVAAPDNEVEKAIRAALLRKVVDASSMRSPTIQLSEEDFSLFRRRSPKLGPSVAIHGAFNGDPQDVWSEHGGRASVSVFGLYSPNACGILGRFCNADASLAQMVLSHAQSEASMYPDEILAEVAHSPEGHVANVVSRPHLREYEIVYGPPSTVSEDRQIPARDLVVTVDGDRILLRSLRLGKIVHPRQATVHYPSGTRSLPVYRFLFLLQHLGISSGPLWHWFDLTALPFLPEVRYREFVLSSARWHVRREDMPAILGGASPSARARNVESWRRRVGLPRCVFMHEGDQKLLVDFTNPLSVRATLGSVKSGENVLLTAADGALGELPAVGVAGRYMHEFVLPTIHVGLPKPGRARGAHVAGRHTSPPIRELASPLATKAVESRRSFLPGEDWLYAKLYCSEHAQERILSESISALLGDLPRDLVAKWFFLRYRDTGHHLRIRFWGGAESNLPAHMLQHLQRMCRGLKARKRLVSLQLDTYNREVERFGGFDAIEHAESLFHADSEFWLKILALLSRQRAPELRAAVRVLSVFRLWGALGIDGSAIERVAGDRVDAIASSVSGSTQLQTFSRTARVWRPTLLRHALAPWRLFDGPDAVAAEEAYRLRDQRINDVLGSASAPVAECLRARLLDFAHLSVNRGSAQSDGSAEPYVYYCILKLQQSLAHGGVHK